jgi:dTDP-4-amino-4,6-dideoxygalactose transaminase
MIEYENLGKLNSKFFDEFQKSFNNSLQSGWYILGKNVLQFEKEFAEYNNSKFCIGVANGLDALILSIRSFSFPSDSEIIVPSNTYIATILAIIHNGLKPVLVEPDINTYNIDPAKIEAKINSRTRAILIVHLYGKPCEMGEIGSICKKYNLELIEDCAQAHGATFNGQKVGTFGAFGAFSFYPTKNLGAIGDAGALLCNNESDANRIKALRNYGSKVKYYNDYIGFNSRLDEIQAAFLSIKLKKLDEINLHKRKLATLYNKYLKEDFIKPVVSAPCNDVFHIYCIRHSNRNKLKEYLQENGVLTEIHYPVPPHEQRALERVFDEKFPISELIHKTILSLPVSFYHTEDDIYRVIEVLNKFK